VRETGEASFWAVWRVPSPGRRGAIPGMATPSIVRFGASLPGAASGAPDAEGGDAARGDAEEGGAPDDGAMPIIVPPRGCGALVDAGAGTGAGSGIGAGGAVPGTAAPKPSIVLRKSAGAGALSGGSSLMAMNEAARAQPETASTRNSLAAGVEHRAAEAKSQLRDQATTSSHGLLMEKASASESDMDFIT